MTTTYAANTAAANALPQHFLEDDLYGLNPADITGWIIEITEDEEDDGEVTFDFCAVPVYPTGYLTEGVHSDCVAVPEDDASDDATVISYVAEMLFGEDIEVNESLLTVIRS